MSEETTQLKQADVLYNTQFENVKRDKEAPSFANDTETSKLVDNQLAQIHPMKEEQD